MASLLRVSLSLITLTVLLGCYSQPSQSLKILALFPLHGKSHFIVCERLAKGLAASGHQVDVYSHFPAKKTVPNYKDFSLKGSMPDAVNNLTYDEATHFQMSNIGALLKTVGHPLCELMDLPVFQELLKKTKNGHSYDLVLIEVRFLK